MHRGPPDGTHNENGLQKAVSPSCERDLFTSTTAFASPAIRPSNRGAASVDTTAGVYFEMGMCSHSKRMTSDLIDSPFFQAADVSRTYPYLNKEERLKVAQQRLMRSVSTVSPLPPLFLCGVLKYPSSRSMASRSLNAPTLDWISSWRTSHVDKQGR